MPKQWQYILKKFQLNDSVLSFHYILKKHLSLIEQTKTFILAQVFLIYLKKSAKKLCS